MAARKAGIPDDVLSVGTDGDGFRWNWNVSDHPQSSVLREVLVLLSLQEPKGAFVEVRAFMHNTATRSGAKAQLIAGLCLSSFPTAVKTPVLTDHLKEALGQARRL